MQIPGKSYIIIKINITDSNTERYLSDCTRNEINTKAVRGTQTNSRIQNKKTYCHILETLQKSRKMLFAVSQRAQRAF